jgi:broad specificity phosphatase PhoE
MRFILIRHGETEEPRPGLEAIGHDDSALSPFGRRQAAALADVLREASDRGQHFEAVYTSPLTSTNETARTIAGALGIAGVIPSDELVTITPEILPEDGALDAVEALQSRAWDLIEALKTRHDAAASIVLVTHELVVRSLVCRALGMPLTDLRRFRLDPASLTTIDYRTAPRERTLLAGLNETCHL